MKPPRYRSGVEYRETLKLDAQWVTIASGWLTWSFERPTYVLGFEFRVHPDEDQHRATTLADFLERPLLSSLMVGNEEQLMVVPVPLGLLFSAVAIHLPVVAPGVLLRLRVAEAVRGFQLRPTGEMLL